MDRNALDWFFSTTPQAIAALVGLIYAGTSFINSKIENAVIADPTLKEISDEFIKLIYNKLHTLLVCSGISIAADLFLIFLNPIFENQHMSLHGTFNLYLTIAIIISSLNLFTIYLAVNYIIDIMAPDYINKTVKTMSEKYINGNIDIATFIKHYIIFEKVLRDYSKDYMNNYKNSPTIYQMARDLRDKNIITNENLHQITTINELRNLILHGGNIKHVENKIDAMLISLTDTITEKIKELKQD